MPTSNSPDLAILTLSWINEQMLLELDRQIAEEFHSPAAFWRRQVDAIVSLLVCGVNLLTLRAFV
jgi:hypothetical protein